MPETKRKYTRQPDSSPPGRPPLAPGRRRDVQVNLRVSPAEKVRIGQAAAEADLSLSDWIRCRLLGFE